MLLGWRPHDLDAAYLPFAHGVGIQIGTSDPAFMATQQLPVRPRERPAWPFDAAALDARVRAGDAEAQANARLGVRWLQQLNSGVFRTWEDVAFLRAHWEGPIVLKGIQAVADAHRAMEVGVDGIVVSNHGAGSSARFLCCACADAGRCCFAAVFSVRVFLFVGG